MAMMRKLIVLTMVCVVPAIATKSAGSAPEEVFNDGEVVLFIGDSITHGGRGDDYVQYLCAAGIRGQIADGDRQAKIKG